MLLICLRMKARSPRNLPYILCRTVLRKSRSLGSSLSNSSNSWRENSPQTPTNMSQKTNRKLDSPSGNSTGKQCKQSCSCQHILNTYKDDTRQSVDNWIWMAFEADAVRKQISDDRYITLCNSNSMYLRNTVNATQTWRTNLWSMNFLARLGWKSCDSRKRRKNS